MGKAFVTTFIYDCELAFNSVDGSSTTIIKDAIKYIIIEHDYRKSIMPVMYMKVNLIPSVYNKMVPEQGKSKIYLKLYRTKRKGSTSSAPKKVIYDEAAGVTVVLWMDGTKTIVRAAEGEEHDAYLGYCIALAKKMHGTNSALKRDLEKVLMVKEDKKLNIPLPTMNGLADKLVEVMQKFNNATTKEE